MVPAVIGFFAYWVRTIARSLRYSIAPTPDGVRITFGLLTTITEIVPPGRVHAVEVAQSILWRPAGWWSIRINRLSGKSLSDTNRDQFTTVLPVGKLADVQRVLELLLPDVPPEEWPLIVRQGVLRPAAGDTFTNSPRRAWFLRPLSWRRNGFRVTPDMLLLRRGGDLAQARDRAAGAAAECRPGTGPDRPDAADRLGDGAHRVRTGIGRRSAVIDRDEALGLFAETSAGAVRSASVDRTHRWAEEEEQS